MLVLIALVVDASIVAVTFVKHSKYLRNLVRQFDFREGDSKNIFCICKLVWVTRYLRVMPGRVIGTGINTTNNRVTLSH